MEGRTPIILLSFNRPHYLSDVLMSIKSQEGVSINDADIYMFQDDGLNLLSGERYMSDAVKDECISVFKKYFPYSAVFQADRNLGVAWNFDRAERFCYEHLVCDHAIFLEDDMVLGKQYLSIMKKMHGMAMKHSNVGYFAAYGNHRASKIEQLANRNSFIALEHNWAFGLTRRQWEAQRPYVQSYLELVRNIDYRQRPSGPISALMRSWGFNCPGTSQDVAKHLGCLKSGGARLNTFTCYAKYVGEQGLHSNKEIFAKMGFLAATYFDEDYLPSQISEDDVKRSIEFTRRYAMNDVFKR